MGCRSDYMEPTEQEEESVLVCQLLMYALTALKRPVPQDVSAAAAETYGNKEKLDDHTAMLCEICKKMKNKEKERVIYNAHLPASRLLAEWWEKHQKADKKRIADENAKRKKQALAESAAKKLTPEELKAITS